MAVHIGFTGTQAGMTEAQRKIVQRLLVELETTDLHHGDCIGSDREAHLIGLVLDLRMHLHIPFWPDKRANCEARQGIDVVYPPKLYLMRNRDIVNAVRHLVNNPICQDQRRPALHRLAEWGGEQGARNDTHLCPLRQTRRHMAGRGPGTG